jgi:hypothetical protein
VKQVLLFGAGMLVNTALLFVIIAGFFRAASGIYSQRLHRTIARVIVMALSAAMVLASIAVGLFVPMFLASSLGLATTQESIAVCVALASMIGLCVLIYAARSPAGRRYSQLGVWGRG